MTWRLCLHCRASGKYVRKSPNLSNDAVKVNLPLARQWRRSLHVIAGTSYATLNSRQWRQYGADFGLSNAGRKS
jgi:hypothetical protein